MRRRRAARGHQKEFHRPAHSGDGHRLNVFGKLQPAMFQPVYLDHNATTPVAPAVLEAMLPFFAQLHGNASSRHEYGRTARRAIDEARQRVAYAVGAHPTEVIFTSGGSEANNLFIKGAAANLPAGIVAISAIEHPCVREPARALRRRGWRLRELAVDVECRLASADFHAALAEQPALISIMLANNETGALQDVAALAAQAAQETRSSVWFHTDAVQALGKVPVDFRSLNAAGVHAMTVSAHKLGGPKGAGALIVDKRVDLAPLIDGGGHERGLRSGTENVPAIVGFGVACEAASHDLAAASLQLRQLRGSLERGLVAQGATIFAAHAERLPNTVYFSLPGIDGETLVARLDRAGFAVASGAACSAANPEPSHVLLAMGVAPATARGAMRVSLGRQNTADDVAGFLRALAATVSQLQSLTALHHTVEG
jgi:cysteine desulfurase